jgi:hypothetical protein
VVPTPCLKGLGTNCESNLNEIIVIGLVYISLLHSLYLFSLQESNHLVPLKMDSQRHKVLIFTVVMHYIMLQREENNGNASKIFYFIKVHLGPKGGV